MALRPAASDMKDIKALCEQGEQVSPVPVGDLTSGATTHQAHAMLTVETIWTLKRRLLMKRRFRLLSMFLVSASLSLMAASCGGGEEKSNDTTKGGTGSDAASTEGAIETVLSAKPVLAYEHVVILGVDGAGAFFSKADTPNMDRIFKDGATTQTMLAAFPSISAQCWGSMLHGVKPEFHRLTNDRVSKTPFPSDSPYPSIFRILREQDADAELASFCNWNPINIGIVEEGLGVHKDTAGDPELTEKILNYLDQKAPKLMFVQFDSVDGAGHAGGYGSKRHLDSISAVDALIGRIYDKCASKNLIEKTLFLVTADHGGTPQGSHGGATSAEMNVFFGAAGKTVVKGNISDCEVRDVAAIAAYALNLKKPETWTGRLPGGLFVGVSAEARMEMQVPKNPNRDHVTVPTRKVGSGSFITDLLNSEKWLAVLTFDDNTEDVTGHYTTKANGKLYYSDGYHGKAASFDDGYVTLEKLQVQSDNFTVAMWVKTTGVNGDPVLCGNKNWNDGKNNGFVLSLRGFDIKFNAGLGGTIRVDAEYPLPIDATEGWMHVAMSVNRKEQTVTFYYDFAKEAVTHIPDTLRNASFSALQFNVGQDGTGSYSSHLGAMLDDFLVYGDAMTEEDIGALKAYYTGK
jgi:hypothetical protein